MLEKDQVCKLGRGWWKLPRFEGANTNDQHPRLWNLGSGVDRIQQVIAIFVNCVDVLLQIVKTCSRTWRANMPTMLSTWMQTCHGSACQREVEAALHFGLIQRTGSKTLVGGGAEIYDIPYLFIYIYMIIYVHTIILKNIKRQKAVQEAPFSILCAQLGEFSGIILRGSMPSPETWGSMHWALVVCRPLSCPARNRWPSSRQGFECHPAWTELAA